MASAGRQDFVEVHGRPRRRPRVECHIAIPEEIPRRLVPRERLTKLLYSPRGGRMVGDRHVHDSAAFVSENHQHEQEPTRRGRRDEEVRGGDLADVIRQERAPRL